MNKSFKRRVRHLTIGIKASGRLTVNTKAFFTLALYLYLALLLITMFLH